MKKIAVIEPSSGHLELFPSLNYFFESLGFEVDFYAKNTFFGNPFESIVNKPVFKLNFSEAQGLDFEDLKTNQYDLFFWNTFVTEWRENLIPIYTFFIEYLFPKYGYLIIEHNQMSIREYYYFLKKQNRFFVIHPRFNYFATNKDLIMPVYFGEIGESSFLNSKKLIFLHIGRVNKAVRNFDLLFENIGDLIHYKDYFEFRFIGDLSELDYKIPLELKENFVFLGKLSFKKMYDEIRRSHFLILPTDLNQLFYISNASSGLINLSIGFHKPIVIYHDLGKLYFEEEFLRDLSFYDKKSFIQTIISLLKLKKTGKLHSFYKNKSEYLRNLQYYYLKKSLKNLSAKIESQIKKSKNELENEKKELVSSFETDKLFNFKKMYHIIEKKYKVLEEQYKDVVNTKAWKMIYKLYKLKETFLR